MEFTQKKYAHKIKFNFQKTHLAYHFDEEGESVKINIPYENIEPQNIAYHKVYGGFGIMPLVWSAISSGLAIFLILIFLDTEEPIFKMTITVFTVSILPVIISTFHTYKKYTDMGHSNGTIRILDEQNHEIIIAEIIKRYKTRMSKLYATIDNENDPVAEKNRFKWLLEQEIITEEEYKQAISEIENGEKPTVQ